MSLFKFGELEAEVDFTDADFMERLDQAKAAVTEQLKSVPKTGKTADILRAQCECFFSFFDTLFGSEAHEAMFPRTSFSMCIDALERLTALENQDADKLNRKYAQYVPNKPQNQEQRRAQEKQNKSRQKKYYQRNGN